MPHRIDKSSRYFQFLLEKKLIDAEKFLEEIKRDLDSSDRSRGYLKGLEGLLLTYRSSDDRYLYFNRTQITSRYAGELKKEFSTQASNELQGEYDKGYFLAMEDFMRTVMKLRPWSAPGVVDASEEKKADTRLGASKAER